MLFKEHEKKIKHVSKEETKEKIKTNLKNIYAGKKQELECIIAP